MEHHILYNFHERIINIIRNIIYKQITSLLEIISVKENIPYDELVFLLET